MTKELFKELVRIYNPTLSDTEIDSHIAESNNIFFNTAGIRGEWNSKGKGIVYLLKCTTCEDMAEVLEDALRSYIETHKEDTASS